MRRAVFTLAWLAAATLPTLAGQLTPWFGNSEQDAFRLPASATAEADPMTTGAVSAPVDKPCQGPGCPATAKPDKTAASTDAPQN